MAIITGNDATITERDPVVLTTPSDGDALNANSVNLGGFQTIANHARLLQRFAAFFSRNIVNAATASFDALRLESQLGNALWAKANVAGGRAILAEASGNSEEAIRVKNGHVKFENPTAISGSTPFSNSQTGKNLILSFGRVQASSKAGQLVNFQSDPAENFNFTGVTNPSLGQLQVTSPSAGNFIWGVVPIISGTARPCPYFVAAGTNSISVFRSDQTPRVGFEFDTFDSLFLFSLAKFP